MFNRFNSYLDRVEEEYGTSKAVGRMMVFVLLLGALTVGLVVVASMLLSPTMMTTGLIIIALAGFGVFIKWSWS